MKEAIAKYLEYLQTVRNSSPHTVSNYGKDLRQFLAFLSPPDAAPPALRAVNHAMIREFVGQVAPLLGVSNSACSRGDRQHRAPMGRPVYGDSKSILGTIRMLREVKLDHRSKLRGRLQFLPRDGSDFRYRMRLSKCKSVLS